MELSFAAAGLLKIAYYEDRKPGRPLLLLLHGWAENEDHLPVTLDAYRSWWDEAEPDPNRLSLKEKVKAIKALEAHSVYFQGKNDGVSPPWKSQTIADKFSGAILAGLTFPFWPFSHREAPELLT